MSLEGWMDAMMIITLVVFYASSVGLTLWEVWQNKRRQQCDNVVEVR